MDGASPIEELFNPNNFTPISTQLSSMNYPNLSRKLEGLESSLGSKFTNTMDNKLTNINQLHEPMGHNLVIDSQIRNRKMNEYRSNSMTNNYPTLDHDTSSSPNLFIKSTVNELIQPEYNINTSVRSKVGSYQPLKGKLPIFPSPPTQVRLYEDRHLQSTSQNRNEPHQPLHNQIREIQSTQFDQSRVPVPFPRSSLNNISYPKTTNNTSFVNMHQVSDPPQIIQEKGYVSLRRTNTETVSIGQNGMVGLKNIGNTCYMNSIIQCLNATIPLSRFFLRGSYSKFINIKNKLGSGGHVVQGYAELLKSIWNQSDPVQNPRKFKV